MFTEELLGAIRAGSGELPPTLRDLLRGRVQALPELARQVFAVVAVAGRRIPHRLLAEVAVLEDQALVQAPDEPLLHYHRGITLMRLSRWREASAAFQTVLRLNPPPEVAAAAREGLQSLGPLMRMPAARSVRVVRA